MKDALATNELLKASARLSTIKGNGRVELLETLYTLARAIGKSDDAALKKYLDEYEVRGGRCVRDK